jgi:hypothetical protein
MRRTLRFIVATATILVAPQLLAQGVAPTTGKDVLARMRAKYAGDWFKLLTFRQVTTLRQADGRDTVQTWYETLRYTPEHGAQLRVDFAPLANGYASIATWDSTWVLRADTLNLVRAGGNPFVALIQGAYMQPVERSVEQLAPLGFDLTKLRTARFEGQPVWVIGATDAADTTSAQFWVDTEHLMVVRIVIGPTTGRPSLDVHLGGLTKCGGGWVATHVEMYSGGARRQLEEYHDLTCDGSVDLQLFNPNAGKTAKHWAK